MGAIYGRGEAVVETEWRGGSGPPGASRRGIRGGHGSLAPRCAALACAGTLALAARQSKGKAGGVASCSHHTNERTAAKRDELVVSGLVLSWSAAVGRFRVVRGWRLGNASILHVVVAC